MLHTAGAGEPHHVYLRRTSARRHFLYGRLKRGRRGSHCRAKAQIPVLSVRVAVEPSRAHTHNIPHLHLPSSLALCFSRGLSQTEAAKYQSLVWGTNSLANCIGSFFGGYVLKYACTPARQRYRSTAVRSLCCKVHQRADSLRHMRGLSDADGSGCTAHSGREGLLQLARTRTHARTRALSLQRTPSKGNSTAFGLPLHRRVSLALTAHRLHCC